MYFSLSKWRGLFLPLPLPTYVPLILYTFPLLSFSLPPSLSLSLSLSLSPLVPSDMEEGDHLRAVLIHHKRVCLARRLEDIGAYIVREHIL